MPKRRHWSKYSKPQTTAPHSLESSGLQSNHHREEPLSRNVNNLLAQLRRASTARGAPGSTSGSGNGSSSSGGSGGLAATTAAAAGSVSAVVTPSVPPELAHILHPGGPLPAGPVLAPGPPPLPLPLAGGGRRRVPAGPAPPPSWLAQSRHAPRIQPTMERLSYSDADDTDTDTDADADADAQDGGGSARQQRRRRRLCVYQGKGMPGMSIPAPSSLVGIVLGQIVCDWDEQRSYYEDYLFYLPSDLRVALISGLSRRRGRTASGRLGVTLADLRTLLTPPPDADEEADEDGDEDGERPQEQRSALPGHDPSSLNEGIRYLDLGCSIERTIHLKELSDLLFPAARHGLKKGHANWRGKGKGKEKEEVADWADSDSQLQESWEADVDPRLPRQPRPLLPNLTHLSLALEPPAGPSSAYSRAMAPSRASWRQLLAFAAHLPMLTHLSLAYWPEPSLTPNAKFTSMVVDGSGGGGGSSRHADRGGLRVQYGGTGPYSHSLDNDWAEAILVVRKLSKALYGLEHLDLTGCNSWLPALTRRAEHDEVDWAGDWGKIETIVLNRRGKEPPASAQSMLTTATVAAMLTDEGGGGGAGAVNTTAAAAAAAATQAAQQPGEVARQVNATSEAQMLERHIGKQRAGRGRFITVVSQYKQK